MAANGVVDHKPIMDSGATHSQWPVENDLRRTEPAKLTLATSNGTVRLLKRGQLGNLTKVYHNPHGPPIISVGKILDDNPKLAYVSTQTGAYMVRKQYLEKLDERAFEKVANRQMGGLWEASQAHFGYPERGKSHIGNANTTFENKAILWHHRLGHATADTLKLLRNIGRIEFSDKELAQLIDRYHCSGCKQSAKAKYTKPNRKSERERNADRPNELGDIVNFDFRDFGGMATIRGYRYGGVFVDQATRYTWYVGTTSKNGSTITSITKTLSKTIERDGGKMKEFVSDGERAIATSQEFADFCNENGIKRRIATSVDHVKQNLAESKICVIRSMARQMLSHRNLEDKYTALAEQYATFLTNILPTSALGGRTPWQERMKKDFNYSNLRMFGAICYQGTARTRSRPYVFVGVDNLHNGYKCYCPRTKKFSYFRNPIWDENDDVTENYIAEMQHGLTITHRKLPSCKEEEEENPRPMKIEVEIDENGVSEDDDESPPPLIETEIETDDDEDDDEEDDDEDETEADNDTPATRRATGELRRFPPVSYGDLAKGKASHANIALAQKFLGNHITEKCLKMVEEAIGESFATTPLKKQSLKEVKSNERHETLLRETYPPAMEIPTPKNTKNSLSSEYAKEWEKARQVEVQNLLGHETFKFVPETPGRHKLKTRYVYAVKHDSQGLVTKFKARLVVLGYGQIWGLEYKDTFAPTASEATIKFNLANAAKKGYKSMVVDYHGAYLHGKMDKLLYLAPNILDLEVPEGMMIRLVKSLYGTKQAGNIWHAAWKSSMIKLGFRQSKYDPCLFIRSDHRGICFAIAWVDDVIFSFNLPQHEMDQIVREIEKLGFILSSVTDLEYYLGIKIEFQEGGRVKLSQKAYLEAILKRFNMDGEEGSRSTKSPMNNVDLPCKKDVPDPETAKGQLEWKQIENYPYRAAIGSLAHAARWTRPDIKFAVGYLARYQIRFSQKHITAIKRIFRYLRGTIDEGITFGGTDTPFVMYVDADFAMDPDCRKSTTGWVALFYGGPGSSKSKLQPILADSTTAAELIAMHDASREAKWLSWLIADFGCSPNYQIQASNIGAPKDPVFIYEDNNGVKAIAEHSMISKQAKHIDIKYYAVQEMVAEQIVAVLKCNTNDNLADILTKPLGAIKHGKMAGFFFRGEESTAE
jgi:hypothetical protein